MTTISTFCISFHIFVADNRRDFKFGMLVEHSKSQPTNDKPSLAWAWSRHVIHFKFQGPQSYISGITEAKIVKFLTQVGYVKCYQKDDITP